MQTLGNYVIQKQIYGCATDAKEPPFSMQIQKYVVEINRRLVSREKCKW